MYFVSAPTQKIHRRDGVVVHAGDQSSIPGRDKPEAVTVPLPNARQQV